MGKAQTSMRRAVRQARRSNGETMSASPGNQALLAGSNVNRGQRKLGREYDEKSGPVVRSFGRLRLPSSPQIRPSSYRVYYRATPAQTQHPVGAQIQTRPAFFCSLELELHLPVKPLRC